MTNFPQGWPKFAQSTVLWRPAPAAIVVASLVPLTATVRQAGNATVRVDSGYPFGDTATITVAAPAAVTVAVRIPGWATAATVDGKPAANGTLVSTLCSAGSTTIAVDLAPRVRVERGWGNTVERSPPADAVAVVRGPLVFALHPRENRTIVRNYTTTPPTAGEHAPDYMIDTDETWNYALDLGTAPVFSAKPSPGWDDSFAFDDSGQYPFSIEVDGCQAALWGHWKGSKITAPPPVSPVARAECGPTARLKLVPFGGTNLRISVFPHV